MKTFIEGEEVIFEHTFYSDKAKSVPVDPTTVELFLEGPDSSSVEPSVSQDGARPANTGKYKATHIVDKWGIWDWRWETSTPTIIKQGQFKVLQNNITD